LNIAKKYDLKVIEDAAQAFGATYKGKKVATLGDIGCISFFPSKNLGAFGDGGMITANDDTIAEKIKMIVSHGSKKKYYHEILGVNSRLDSIQGAILNVKLRYIEEYHNARIKSAGMYNERLKGCVGIPYIMPDVKHIFHQYSIKVKDRDELKSYLAENGVPSMIYYPVPLHLQEAYKYGYKQGDFPVTEKISGEILSLPIHTELGTDQIDYISEKIKNFYR
jgi:dTDP-4-amino-4,6-dideoxygalactose transaminase